MQPNMEEIVALLREASPKKIQAAKNVARELHLHFNGPILIGTELAPKVFALLEQAAKTV